jgi:hypothetical protein
MRNSIVGVAALATAVILSSAAFAGQKTLKHTVTFDYPAAQSSDYNRPETFTILRPGDQSKGTSAFIKAHANKDEAQAQISGDRALASELRAHGVQLNNVIGISKAFNGKLIVYIK